MTGPTRDVQVDAQTQLPLESHRLRVRTAAPDETEPLSVNVSVIPAPVAFIASSSIAGSATTSNGLSR
jgi:hypothetical protein